MNQFCELSISHLNQSKLLIYENGTSLKDFLKNLQKEFKIQRKIKLTDSNAEITSVKSFYNGRKLLIEIIKEDEQDIEVDKSDQNDEEDKNSFAIQLDGIADIKYSSEELFSKLNEWAIEKKFKLMKSEGTKSLKNGISKTLICSVKNCKFWLTFKSDHNDFFFELDKKLGEKIRFTGRLLKKVFKM